MFQHGNIVADNLKGLGTYEQGSSNRLYNSANDKGKIWT